MDIFSIISVFFTNCGYISQVIMSWHHHASDPEVVAVMAGFDGHEKCSCRRDKNLGKDPCVTGKDCIICDNFMDLQRSVLTTPQYQIRKDKKSGVLVSPSKVTVAGPVDTLDEDSMPQDSAQAQAGSS